MRTFLQIAFFCAASVFSLGQVDEGVVVESVVERAGVAILTEATGIDTSDAFSLLRAQKAATLAVSQTQQDSGYDAASFTGSVRELLVYETNLEKKLLQIFDGMKIPHQMLDLTPSLAGAAKVKHDFLAGSSVNGKLTLNFVRFFPSGSKNGKDLFTIQTVDTSCTMLDFPDIDFALMDREGTSSAQSPAYVRKRTASPRMSADDIARTWALITQKLVEQFFKLDDEDSSEAM